MIRYFISKYLAHIHSFKMMDKYYYYGFPIGGHSRDTVKIYYTVPNLIHIEGHLKTNLYTNHFHRSLFIPKHANKKDVVIIIKDGFIKLYVPLLSIQSDKKNETHLIVQ